MFGRKKQPKVVTTKELVAAYDEDRWRGLFDRAEQGDFDAMCEVVIHFSMRRFNLPEYMEQSRLEATKKSYDAIVSMRVTTERLQTLRDAKTLDEQIDVLAKLVVSCERYHQEERLQVLESELGFNSQEIAEQLQAAVTARYQELLDGREEANQFYLLRTLIFRTGRKKSSSTGLVEDCDLREAGVGQLDYPDDWNELVARHYEAPGLSVFRELPEQSYHGLPIQAAKALREDDLTLAQVVLAYRRYYRYAKGDPVGEVLSAELAKLVDRHRAALEAPANTPD